MTTNPFDDPEGLFRVLRNDEGQHSLWPAFVDNPSGWTTAHPEDTRLACLEYVESTWTDLRPASLVAAMQRTVAPVPEDEGEAC
jgi:MbtH protein